MSDEMRDFKVRVVTKTDAAILVVHDDEEFWIPFSQIDDDSEVAQHSETGDDGVLTIPQWLAEKKGME